MKKIMMIVVCLVMLFALAACGSDPALAGTTTQPDVTTSSVEEPVAPTDPTEPPHVHEWQAATCTAPQTCLECGETQGDANGHNWQEATTLRPKTCKVCGMTEGGVIYDIPDDDSVAIPENNCFEKDTVVKVEEITVGAEMDMVDQAMEAFAEQYVAYTFTATKDEVAVQPVGKLTVTFAIPDGFSTNVSVFYIPEEGYMEQLDAVVDAAARTVTVELKHFSTYGMVDEATVVHEHLYEYETIAPTCILDGYTLQSCTECEHVHKSEIVDALGHNWIGDICTETRICDVCGAQDPVKGHQWTPATCTEPKTCSVCYETEGQANGHAWMDATCTTAQTCAVCHAVGDPEKGHHWDTGVVTKEPTEEAEGEKRYTCTDCGETKKEIIPELNHEHQYTAKITEPTCTNRGYTTYTCSCGETYDDAFVDENGHTWVNANCTTPQTCSVCQTVEGEALGHKWEDATCTTPKTCSECQATEGDVAEHIWNDGVVTKEATEEAEGEKLFTCTACKAIKTEVIPKLDHVHQYEAEVTHPACEKDGYTTYTCRCGDAYTDDKIAATGHAWTPATCTTPKTCSTCQATEGEVAEHPWDEGVVTKEATEEAEGEKLYTCTGCKTTKTEVIPKPDHVHLYDKAEVTAPTCTERGYTTYTCRCGDTYTGDETAATGHSYTSVVTAPTCTEKGYTTHTCHCGDVKIDGETPATGHSYVSKVTAPTCTQKGFTTHTCHCGDSYTDAETAATGHSWRNATCTEVKKCTVCQATEGEVLGHDWKAATCTKPETCSRCKITQGNPRGHSCANGTCAYCGETVVTYSKGLEFTLSNDKKYYILSGIGTCTDTDIIIPPTHNGLPVREIGRYAFWNCVKLTSIIIPDSVTSIGLAAFNSCSSITIIIIPDSVVNIGSSAFARCSSLTTITIPESVTVISEGMLHECANLRNITLGEKVTRIERMAFSSCSNLSDIKIPDSVTYIGDTVFNNCTALKMITLPKKLQELDASAFDGCVRLAEYSISEENKNFCTVDGILYSKDKTVLILYPAGKTDATVVTPSTVHTIGKYAFSRCVNLQSITFSGAVKTIEYGAFQFCTKLAGIELPNTLITLDAGVFCGCTSLEAITIPDSVKNAVLYETFCGCTNLKTVVLGNGVIAIGRDAFGGCIALEQITIPASVTEMGYCFEGCNNLKEIRFLGSWTPDMSCVFGEEPRSVGLCVAYYPAGNSTWTSDGDFPNLLLLPDNYGNGYFSQGLNYTLSKDGTYYIVTGIGSCTDPSIVIPSIYKDLPVCEIASNAFADSTIDVLVLSDSLQRIGSDIAKEITHLFLPNQVVSLGNLCHISRSIYIDPDNVCYVSVDGIIYTKDMQMLVYYGGNDAAFTVPDSVVHIADYAFADKKLCTINLPSGLQTIGNYAFHACGQLISLMIPNGVTNIGEHAFSECEKLNSIELPQKITVIENYTFAFCHQLTTVIIPSSVTGIGEYAFHDNLALISIIVPENVTQIGTHAFAGCWSLVNVTLPKGITTIGNYSFSGCGFTSITLPDSITVIGDGAFSGCGGLTSITIPNGVAVIGDSLFSGCRSLTSVTLPDSVTSIGKRAFYECEKLTSITIPQKLTSIEEETFCGCSSLISITIPNGVTSIGDKAFGSCSNLESVTLGTGVITIGSSAFMECSSLSGITIPNNVTRIGREAFACSGLKEITLPDSVTWLGAEAFYHCTRLESANIGKGSITANEFVGCTRLKNVTIREGATAIAAGMFWNCNSLEHIVIPKSVTRIDGGAFMGCSKLKSITLTNKVVTIGGEAFSGCVNLVDINFDGTKAQWEAISKVFMWGQKSHKCTIHCTDGNIEE